MSYSDTNICLCLQKNVLLIDSETYNLKRKLQINQLPTTIAYIDSFFVIGYIGNSNICHSTLDPNSDFDMT